MVDFGGAQKGGVYADMFLPVETRVAESSFHELPNRVGNASSNYIIVRRVLLEHEPHGSHIIPGKTPVTTCIKVAKAELAGKTQFDPRHAVGHLARHELDAATRRLM